MSIIEKVGIERILLIGIPGIIRILLELADYFGWEELYGDVLVTVVIIGVFLEMGNELLQDEKLEGSLVFVGMVVGVVAAAGAKAISSIEYQSAMMDIGVYLFYIVLVLLAKRSETEGLDFGPLLAFGMGWAVGKSLI